MIQILHLRVLFNDVNKARIVIRNKLIKQLTPLLFLFFSLTIFIHPTAFAKQETLFTQTTSIYSILQDKKDFIWLSGQNGLFRFDSKQVINFSNNEKDWSIPFTWIQSISSYEDKLILATETKGLWLFDTETGKAQSINLNAETSTFYRAIHHRNSFYAVSMAPQHLYRYDIATAKTTMIAENINNTQLFASGNRVYFNNKNKLFYLDSNIDNNKIQQVDVVNERIISATSINNTAIVASENHLFSINDSGEIIKKNTSSAITAITPHNNQQDILSVNLLGEITKREIRTLNELESNFTHVEKSRYSMLLHDNSGVLWLGNDRGIQQLTEKKVNNHPAIFNTNYSYNQTEIHQDKLYLGTYGLGMYYFSPFTETKVLPIENINLRLSNKAKKIHDLLAINENLYMATFEGVWRYNRESQHTNKIILSFENNDFSNLIILKLVHKEGLLYIATDGQGLIIYSLNERKVIHHIRKSQGLSSGEVIDVLPLINDDIWLATASGVDVFNKQTNTVKNVINKVSSKFISLLQVDDKIFVTSKGNGIHVYNQQRELLAHFAKGINFSEMSLIDDYILASAKPGLYKIDPTNYQFAIVTDTNDFSFTDNAFIFNDALFIANSSGLLQLPRTTPPIFHPKVYISKTTVSGKSYLLNKTIKVNSGNDVITLDLASLDYRKGLEKQYRYTLNGNKWHQINSNQLTLTGLAPGDYHIEIMATNSLGQWSEYKAFTEINVAFPWYWTPKIRLVFAVSLFGLFCLITWLLFLRSKSISHIYSLLENDLHNYGKINMQVKRNLTAALSLITQNELSKGKLLLQQCVDDLNEQHQSSEPNSLGDNTLAEAVPFLVEYLNNKYQVTLSYESQIDENELVHELQADLYRVIFEAVSSSVLNGNGRSFKVVLQKFKNKIWLNISDDSQSFIHFNSKVNFNLPMYYIRRIASKNKGSVNTFNEQGHGSQLVLSLPIMNGK